MTAWAPFTSQPSSQWTCAITKLAGALLSKIITGKRDRSLVMIRHARRGLEASVMKDACTCRRQRTQAMLCTAMSPPKARTTYLIARAALLTIAAILRQNFTMTHSTQQLLWCTKRATKWPTKGKRLARCLRRLQLASKQRAIGH